MAIGVAAVVLLVDSMMPAPARPRPEVSATSVDATGSVTVEYSARLDTAVEIRGWRRSGGAVEIRADGIVVATVLADEPRPSVADALDLADDRIGFSATVDIPGDTVMVCAASPAAVPAHGACDGPSVDLDVHRVVAFYGAPGIPAMGVLSHRPIEETLTRLRAEAAEFATADTPVLPAFEVIATIAQNHPGDGGDYTRPVSSTEISEYIEGARSIGGITILDFQPGHGDLHEQLLAVEDLLIEPDVHVAIDPEWDMPDGLVPGSEVGHTTAAELNTLMGYLDGLIRDYNLPRKLFIAHQFQDQMIRDRSELSPPETVQLVLHMDGHGAPAQKIDKYQLLADGRFHDGFKLFYDRDIPLMTAAQVLAVDPDVEFISYQ